MSRLAGTLFFLLIILLHLGTGTFAINAKSGKKTKVLILGAGVSGIIAAKTLADKNIADFIVLEGQDYVGGRVKHVPFGVVITSRLEPTGFTMPRTKKLSRSGSLKIR